ncbi:hypothetical protein OAG10_05490 [Verrucomicrobia bacterium]|nr:hypothetical protein [Verrucomicrobiota bacterium]
MSLFGFFAERIAMVFVPLINWIAAGIESLAGIFFTGYSLGRILRKKEESKSTTSAIAGIMTLLTITVLLGWFFVLPKVMNKEITLVAGDSYRLPLAALVVHTKDGDRHERTDKTGNILIPRFNTISITVKDPRYVEKTWETSEIKSELIVERTVLGSGLDFLADKLLRPANE